MSYVFTAKGAKGFASGAAKKACEAAGLQYNPSIICQHEGKWGFWSLDGVPCGAPVVETEPEAPVAQGVVNGALITTAAPAGWDKVEADDPSPNDEQLDAAMAEQGGRVAEKVSVGDDADQEKDEESDPVAIVGMFGGMAATLGAVAQTAVSEAPVAQAAPKGYKIEKDRPEQNGIKRPSAGGLCRAVWDWCDSVREATGAPPVAAQVREHSETVGWNVTNGMIEFYQWRKFNGITGRSKKPSPELAQKAAEAGAVVAQATEAPVAETTAVEAQPEA